MEATQLETPMIDSRYQVAGLSVHAEFYHFVEHELLPAIGMRSGLFWEGVAAIHSDLKPTNRRLLQIREELQAGIDQWHRRNPDGAHDDYVSFLKDTGYLVEKGAPFSISTRRVDPEISKIAGPQLVVPVSNARFAINAANARWGSLFDAFYGTDAIEHAPARPGGYDESRGKAVIDASIRFLDETLPLRGASHAEVDHYCVDIPLRFAECFACMPDGRKVPFRRKSAFRGWSGYADNKSLLFRNNGLHIEIKVNPDHPVGQDAPGHIADIVLESAVTTIQDCEDSVAAVDAEDKSNVYRNWLGLMQGTIKSTFDKGDRTITRRLNQERKFIAVDGSELKLPGTSLMLVRNVGHLMTTDTIIDEDGDEFFEGILDAVITTACGIANSMNRFCRPNSRYDSIYIVKPKMHGPDEAAFTNTLFERVEKLFKLKRHTMKLGLMDEERRTSLNLSECIRAIRERLVFINTGFLDRTGDEIHTSMRAGAFLPKDQIKQQPCISAYEESNVETGIHCGLPGRAQIGKGMWPKPDEMKQMLDTKGEHVEAGANCAWVPSPTAATLHAIHYHQHNARRIQRKLADTLRADINDILTPPLMPDPSLSPQEIKTELDNNVQGILGYVVRWIDAGIGCSKVPDINDTGLMEDRATLRISSQHIANWLLHGICTEDQVRETLERMAAVVDEQNANTPGYQEMCGDLDSNVAFQAANALIFEGLRQPSGYTEPLLHRFRQIRKDQASS